MCKRNSPHKKEASMVCVKKLPIQRNVKRVIFEKMCQFRFYLPVAISVSRDLFVFVLFCKTFFLRLSLMQMLALVVLSFYHFEGSFHF